MSLEKLFVSVTVFLLKELDSLEDKSETEEWKCKERWKDDRREERSNQIGEERDRRWWSRDPDDQSRRSRSISPSKWIQQNTENYINLSDVLFINFPSFALLIFPPTCFSPCLRTDSPKHSKRSRTASPEERRSRRSRSPHRSHKKKKKSKRWDSAGLAVDLRLNGACPPPSPPHSGS